MTDHERELLQALTEAPRVVLAAPFRGTTPQTAFVAASMAVSKSHRFLYRFGSPGAAQITSIRGASDQIGGVALFIGTGAVRYGGEMIEGGMILQRWHGYE